MARQMIARLGPTLREQMGSDVKPGSGGAMLSPLPGDLDSLIEREWLATNGLGSYASSTIPGLNTRKYHGLLVAAMSPPVHRVVLLSRTEETVTCDGHDYPLDCNEYPGVFFPRGDKLLKNFDSHPNPRWAYGAHDWKLQRELRLVEGENTVVLAYTNTGDRSIDLAVRPMLALRSVHALTYQWNGRLRIEKYAKNQIHILATSRTPEVFIAHDGTFTNASHWYLNQIYRLEERRGYAGLEDVWTPGIVRFALEPGQTTHLVCSAEPIDWLNAMREPARMKAKDDPTLQMLTRAAEQFIVRRPATDEVMSVAAYPWLGPEARSQLIAFTGMFLLSGRFEDARDLLLNLASRFEAGLLNGEAADVSLWFINAIWSYHRYSSDAETTRKLLGAAVRIIVAFRAGNAPGVTITAEGLLDYRDTGAAATWMNGKLADHFITPRLGMAVETNALWFNAINIAADLAQQLGRSDAHSLIAYAESILAAFNEQFWNAEAGCCFDVIDNETKDASIRPSQLLAISLPFAVLDPSRHASLVEVVRRELLTPFGVRTLNCSDAWYRAGCEGNVETRERACFNGAAHPWLLAHFVRANAKVCGPRRSRAEAVAIIEPMLHWMRGRGMGQLPEIFDGDMPHAPGGAPASAVSVCELLRCYAEDVLSRGPKGSTVRPSASKHVVKGTSTVRQRHEQHPFAFTRESCSIVTSPIGSPTASSFDLVGEVLHA